MRSTFVFSILGVLAVGGIAGCASSERTAGSRTLFADPGQFESLASGPYEAPRAVVAESAPVAPESPVAAVPTAPEVSAPTAKLAAFDGASLVSAPEFVDTTKANRVVALATVVATAAPTVAPTAEAAVSGPEDAYVAMLRGNERFVAGITRGERRDETRRRSLASVQNPHTIVLSCSDSRVPPELIFDQGLGDLYTIRVSGNVLGSAQVASIETAVEKHGAKLIVVMGHESCETVQAALGQEKGSSTDQAWLASEIRPNLIKNRALASATATPAALDPKLRQPVMANVDAVTEQLLVRSRIVSGAVQSGKLRITRGIYSLESGRVDFWGTR